ncbi:MAG: glycosyltransferase family protein [Deltaproteobacteria bacterium]|nr:glycosyltransferase family protein [Deltaproteobacteria bacterium]
MPLSGPRAAVEVALAAASAAPQDAGAWVRLAEAWSAAGEAGAALDALLRAAQVEPGRPGLRARLGAAQLRARQAPAALRYLQAAVLEDPRDFASAANLGECLRALGELTAAERALRRALSLRPPAAIGDELRWNLALCLRMAGQEAEGLRLYEVRRRLPGFSLRLGRGPVWAGGPLQAPLAVIAEQGLGDTLQHVGLLRSLRARAGADLPLLLVAQAPLLPLLEGLRATDPCLQLAALPQTADAIDALIAERLGSGALQAPLMSLPLLLGLLSAEARAAAAARLPPDPARSAQWAARLEAGRRPGARLVGLCWQGNPAYPDDASRSVPLQQLVPLARDPRVQLVVLQQKHGREQLARWPANLPLWDLAPELDGEAPFVDTAAVLPLLDAVVTSDTSTLHLAAAVGARTHALLSAVPDWRFGLVGETLPGAPRLRLHRQRRPGDWTGPVQAVAAALAAEAAKGGG